MTLVQQVHEENQARLRDADNASTKVTAAVIRDYAQQLIDCGYKGWANLGCEPYLDMPYDLEDGKVYRRPPISRSLFGLLIKTGKEEIELKDIPYEKYPYVGYLEHIAGDLEKRLNSYLHRLSHAV